MTKADLPGQPPPSPEVLDELLRAFSADTTDEARIQRVDLTSPEVDELLADSSAAAPRPEPELQRQPDPTPEPVDVVDEVDEVEVDEVDEVPSPSPPGEPLLAGSTGSDTAPVAAQVITDGRIFIEDSTATDSISIEEAVTATRIEPRMRERRVAVRKARGRKRLKWFLVVFFSLAVVVAGLAILGSGLFAIEDVEIEGADRTDPAALGSVVEELRGTPVLRADTEAAEAALEAIPWVQDARVTTDFPHGARIELRERTAVASYAAPDGSFRTIDPEGRVLEVVEAQPADHLLVTSDEAPDLAAGEFAPPGYRAAASLVEAFTPQMRALAGSVRTANDGSDLRVLLADGTEVRFGAGQDLVAKLVRLQTWLDTGRDGATVRTVDVSTDEVTTS